MILMILYFIFAFITTTLCLITCFDEDPSPDGDGWAIYTLGSLILGLIFPITIWFALIRWYTNGDVPLWAETLWKVFQFIRRLFKKDEK